MNRICIVGRLGRDPEQRQTGSGVNVCQFSVAVNRRFKDKQTGERQTDWFDVVAWRQTADFCAKYLQKGSLVSVTGSMQQRKYQAKDGSNRTAWELQADEVRSVGGKDPTEEQSLNVTPPAAGNDDFALIEDEGDLPF